MVSLICFMMQLARSRLSQPPVWQLWTPSACILALFEDHKLASTASVDGDQRKLFLTPTLLTSKLAGARVELFV